MNPNQRAMMNVILEFLVSLGKVVWLTILAFLKWFLPAPKKDVSKEVVLITGAGSGIGRLMSHRFAEMGATVVLWDIDKKSNDAVAKEITEKGHVAHAFYCDCSKREDIYHTAAQRRKATTEMALNKSDLCDIWIESSGQVTVSQRKPFLVSCPDRRSSLAQTVWAAKSNSLVKQDIGDVTVLVNNAGIISGRKLVDVPDDKADLTFRVNTIAHFWTLKAFLPSMIAKNYGHIITIASSAGLFGVAGLVDYCASKFGAVGIHEAVSSELASIKCDGVHATCICPYFIDTGMFDGVTNRFPRILPLLTPEYAVDRILTAFHRNQSMVMMPRILYFFYFMQSFMPKAAMLEAAEFFGSNRTMDTFKGRQKRD